MQIPAGGINTIAGSISRITVPDHDISGVKEINGFIADITEGNTLENQIVFVVNLTGNIIGSARWRLVNYTKSNVSSRPISSCCSSNPN